MTNNPITIHIFQDGPDHNGVNARQNGKWLNYDDRFNTLMSAQNYAFSVYTDWNGKEIKEYCSIIVTSP